MKTNVITVDEAIKNGTYKWNKHKNDIDFLGIIPGYVCGWCVEVKKQNGEIGYCSCTFTNDYEEIRDPNYYSDWNSLGISAELASYNGAEPTGNIVFRGYHSEEYDWKEREEYYLDKSEEVLNLWNKYVVV